MKLCRSCERPAAKGRKECLSCYGHRRRGTSPRTSGPRILSLDIETSPNLADVWGLWNNNVGLSQLRESTRMICFAAKWMGAAHPMFASEHHDGHDAMVETAWGLLDQADVVMTWNGKSFDSKHLAREFLLSGMTPPSPYRQLDLLETVRRQFRFPSNKLQYVSKALGLQGKVSHEGHELWIKCLDGDDEAWSRMREYNEQDTVLLEELYHILLPWISNHPHLELYGGAGGCGRCGSHDVHAEGQYRTALSTFPQYRCHTCGTWLRGTRRLGGVSLTPAVIQ